MEVHKVGSVDDPEAKPIRIVHISDTHMHHDDFLNSIPPGDILIHSGDFCGFTKNNIFMYDNINRLLREMDAFFGKVPCKHSIFVAGNHDVSLTTKKRDWIQSRLENVHYLQDCDITLEGIRIHGTPWTAKRMTSYAHAFTKSMGNLEKQWNHIPTTTDIVVTHMPPLGILDLASKKFRSVRNLFTSMEGMCNACGEGHDKLEHWGCPSLQRTMLEQVRPSLHLFGHVHETSGVQTIDGVTFSNGAMKINGKPNVFDFYVKPSEPTDATS